jgi:hypothetical protein
MEENKLNQLANLNEIVCVQECVTGLRTIKFAIWLRNLDYYLALFRRRLPPRIRALRCELGELKQRLQPFCGKRSIQCIKAK